MPASGDQGRRLVRHHGPLAVASAAALLLFMTLPGFDPQAYPRSDMTGVALPRPISAESSIHDTERPPAGGHDGRTPAAGHGSDRSSATGHSGDPRALEDRVTKATLTTATGYVATVLLALTLLIGPLNLMLRRRNPLSSYLRRDVGAWTAGVSVVHVVLGLQLHGTGELPGFLLYFFAANGGPLLDAFGLGNWTGLAATAVALGLLAISSDLALRALRADRWKWLQRLNYGLFALVVAHAFFYGALLRTTSPFTRLLVVSVLAVCAAQATGVILWRRRHGSIVSSHPPS